MSKKPIPVEEPGAAPVAAPDALQASTSVDITDSMFKNCTIVNSGVEVIDPPLIAQPTGHLPDQSEVDPAKITTNTLTKQGWVLPTAATAQAAG